MLGSRTGIAAIALSTLVFAASASAQGSSAPAKIAPVAAKPATPPKADAAAKAAKPPADAAEKPAVAAGPRTIVGEVIDPACWIINGAGGKGHSECAAACAKAGQTLAILEKRTNKVYILAGDKPGEDPNKGVAEYVGQPVVVKGRVYARGGALGLRVQSIEPYNAKLAAETP